MNKINQLLVIAIVCIGVFAGLVYMLFSVNPDSRHDSQKEMISNTSSANVSKSATIVGNFLAENGSIYNIVQTSWSNGTTSNHLVYERDGLMIQDFGNVIKLTYYKTAFAVPDVEPLAMKKISAYSEKGYQIVEMSDIGSITINNFGQYDVKVVILQKVTQQVTLENATGAG